MNLLECRVPAFAPITIANECRRGPHGVGWLAACVLAAVLASSCKKPLAAPSAPAPPIASTKVKITTIKNVGGRLDWSKSNLIAFDQIGSDGYFDVFTMNPDGSNERCLTCDQPALPNRHIGNPAWHPSGNYLAIQVEKADTPRNIISDIVASPGSGINNNIWVMDVRSTTFTQLTDVPLSQGGVLHPHFSPSGTALLWSERLSAQGGSAGTWALKVADFSADGGPHVSNVRTFQPGQQHLFYEPSSFSPDGRTILFSGNLEPAQSESDMDIYTLNLDSGALSNLTNTPTQWDEHAQMSPLGDRIAWMSSSGVGGAVDSIHPLTDYWMMKPDGSEKTQITYFNDSNHAEYVGRTGATAADASWNPDGTKLMAYVILDQLSNNARMMLLEFSTAIQPSSSVPAAQPQQVVERVPAMTESVASVMTLTTRASDRSPYEMRLAVADDDAVHLDEWSGTVDRWFADRALDRTANVLDPLAADRRHERLTQMYNSVPVFGGEIARQLTGQRPVSILGTFYTDLSIDTVPTLTPAQARDLLLKQAGMAGALIPDDGSLVVLPRRDGTYSLAYSLRAVTPDDLVISFVDAHSGELLEWYSDFQGGRRSLPPASASTATRFASLSAIAPVFEPSTTYDFRGLAQTTFQLLGGSGSRAWVESFGASNHSQRPTDGVATSVEAQASIAMGYLVQRLGTNPFVSGSSPSQVVHPDDPRVGAHRPGLFARGPFYAGNGVSVFPDPLISLNDAVEAAFSLQTVAHELGHALVDSTSRLVNRGEAGALNEGIAELIGRSAATLASGHPAMALPPASGPPGSDPLMIARVVDAAAQRAAADGVSIRPGLEKAFLRAAAFMLPANATLKMARVATLQAARDLEPGGAIERYLRTAWTDAGVP